MKQATTQSEIEKGLHKRLKFIGYVMLVFAAIAIAWDFFPATEDELDELILEMEEAPPPMNPYLVSSAFALVGTSCFFIYWKKKAQLSNNS